MSVEKKLAAATKLTNKREAEVIRRLAKEYEVAYTSIKQIIADAVVDYGIDGKLDYVEMQKYDRLIAMQKSIEAELHVLNNMTTKQIEEYAHDVYYINYYNTAFALETTAQVKLGYGLLPRKTILEAAKAPLTEIAIQNNRDKVIRDIRSSLVQAMVQGKSIPDTAKSIKANLETNANNAVRIARTETTRISNKSRMDSINHAAGKCLEMEKIWLATVDDRTRVSHANIDGQKRPLDKPFSNGLMYPGDPAGGPEEVINCRCTLITQIKGLEDIKDKRRIEGKVVPYQNYEDWYKNRVA